jgi:hypothetical protein
MPPYPSSAVPMSRSTIGGRIVIPFIVRMVPTIWDMQAK